MNYCSYDKGDSADRQVWAASGNTHFVTPGLHKKQLKREKNYIGMY